MIDEFIKNNSGCAVIFAGSDSDKVHIGLIAESLQKYSIPFDVRICSAHKQPDKLLSIINEYNAINGLVAYIAVARGTDALSGMLSFHALGPVISCPPDNPNFSCINNPSGSSNAYIANPSNVARFIAQIYSGINPVYRRLLEEEKTKKITSLEKADKDMRR